MEKKKTGKARRLLHILWILPLLIALTFGVLMYVVPAMEDVDRTAVAGSADWMAKLPDEKPLSEVVLPGTHDSATKGVQLAFITKCQALTVAEQLEAGFRYLDIRLTTVKGSSGAQDRMKLMHGFCNCTTDGWPWAAALYLDDVLTDCYAFLAAHPTETIVFAVKHEHGSETPEEFEAARNGYIAKNPDAWLLTDRIPTVGSARGKIVLLRHYETPSEPDPTLGIKCYWDKQDKNDDVSKNIAVHEENWYTLFVQDRYKYAPSDKLNAFREGLKNGKTNRRALSIHFLSTSGAASYGHPFAYAKELNAALLSSEDTLNGWIVVDFGSPAIAARIYEANFES